MAQDDKVTTRSTSHISKSLLRTDPLKNSFSFTPLVATRQISKREALATRSFSFFQVRTAFLSSSSTSSIKLFNFNKDFIHITYLLNKEPEVKPLMDDLESSMRFIESIPANTRKNLILFAEFALQYPTSSFIIKNVTLLKNRTRKLFSKCKNTSSLILTESKLNSILAIISFQCIKQTDLEIIKALLSFGDAICAILAFLIITSKGSNKYRNREE